MFYEFCRSDVAAGRRPALIDRYERFTAPRWKALGIRLVGCWTPAIADKSSQLIYLLAWASDDERQRKTAAWRADDERARVWAETEKDGPLVDRTHHQLLQPTAYSQLDLGVPYASDAAPRSPWLFELREYQAMPGKLQNVVDRFGNYVCRAFRHHGFHQVGYWTPSLGGNDHQLLYMLAWASLDEREARFDAFLKDPERVRVFAEEEKDGPIVQQSSNSILRPTSFSPMK